MGRILECLENLMIKTAIVSSLAILLAFTYCEMDEDNPGPKKKSTEERVILNKNIEINESTDLSYDDTLVKNILPVNIIESARINYTVQPDIESNKNWYGSGDADNDNLPLNENDLIRLSQVANGTYTNPDDKRLIDRCDINGDNCVNFKDVEILRERLNGSRPYLPGEWNQLQTREEQMDWAKKMLAIDLTNLSVFPGGDCNQYSDQIYINFHGVSVTDIPMFLEVYPYDFTNNGRFNLPLFEIITAEYDSTGKFIYGHALNTFIFGNPSSSGSLCPIEPQNDSINIKFGEDPLLGINSKVFIRGTPVLGTIKYIDGKRDISMNWYVKQDIRNNIPTYTWINPDLIINVTKEKSALRTY